ncbi:MAG: OmpH family outer membrane protein [Proteobacteria bacterium]|nr:OmpH family outer membrane protein [Pseudomonadota bacterium]
MNIMLKPFLGAGLVLALAAQPALAKDKPAPAATPAPVAAPASTGTVVPGIGVADINGAMAGSNAFTVAQQQRAVTYKSTYDAAQTKAKALEAQLKPLIDKFNADRQGGKVPTATLQQQAQAIQAIQAGGKQEIERLLMPASLSEAYVQEQIEDKIDQAVKNAMNKRGVTLLLAPQAVMAIQASAYDLNPAIVAELNTLLPTATLVPPAGWEPRQVREARAQQAQQQGGTAPAPRPATPAGPQPDSR